ncbi:hypothetical protein BJ165DRAFT_617819 [Panaeolus papilionaceus]|nr:hypothetical protein BJ165DRAFT_617819 [Panaeolus papilionaceus]
MTSTLAHPTSIQEAILFNNYLGAASLAILYYDYLLTFSCEYERFWKPGRHTWASTFFYLNRYLTLLGHGPIIVQYFWTPSGLHMFSTYVGVMPYCLNCQPVAQHLKQLSSCTTLSAFHQYLAVVIQIIVGVLLIMRTYALYGSSRRILAFLCACGGTVIGYGVWCVMTDQSKPLSSEDVTSLTACLLPVNDDSAAKIASAWTGMLAFDILIFSMTVYRSWLKWRNERVAVLQVMLRDGSIYFAIMSISSLSVILTFHLLEPYSRGVTVTLTNILSSTMLSRLMLNLRDPKLISNNHDIDTTYVHGNNTLHQDDVELPSRKQDDDPGCA